MNVSSRYQIKGKSGNQIAASIEAAVRAGRLEPGARLPAIRALADRLGVSPTTVAGAYRALRVRGLLRGSGRRGTTVNPRPPLATPAPPPVPAGVRDLANGNPDVAMLPRLRDVLRRLECPPLLYGGAVNREDLVRMAARGFRADGVAAGPIAILSGAMDAMERVLGAHLRPGDMIGIEDPSYSGTLDSVAALGLVAEPIALDDFGPVPRSVEAALRAGSRAIILTPRAQNPTGAAFDRRRVAALSEVLSRYPEVLVIEDDFAGPVAGAPPLTLCDRPRERWAVIRSVSKALGPDLRIAVLTGDPVTIARVEGRQRLGPRWVSHMLQEALAVMWSDDRIAAMVRRAAETYSARRKALIRELAKYGIAAQGRSGLNVWIPVQEEAAVAQALLGAGWAVRAGERFRIKSAPGIRVTVATLEVADAPRLARDIAAAVRPSAVAHVV
jgi:DNA-binding transcriptional MocR family regulator